MKSVVPPNAAMRLKIESEIAFRNRLVAALDKQGYIVKENDATTCERARVSLRNKYKNVPALNSTAGAILFVFSKCSSASFCLTVWFSSDEPSPKSFNWHALGGDGVSVAGPSKRQAWDGVSYCDATPPLCYHVSIIDARLRFETLSLTVMRDILLDGHLAEELASKVAVAFDRICAMCAEHLT